MAETSDLGPVELVVFTFPGARVGASAKNALHDVVDRGYVTVLDLVFLHMAPDGALTQVEIDEPLEEVGLDGITVDARGLVSDDDLDVVRSTMRPGTSALVVVYEQTWARTLSTAVSGAGGEVALHVQVPRDAVEAALAAS
ncbi:DUF1269 domain-containing protein [Nocardia uniformis]|uniref:DUF1269 domain-containing protein n=1 Tax=Nocardia uniformis TaxID=53432 RepID=A0A849C8I9_9NOCA|nr:DUF6325 family protein [Nocardia uniformis]NNH71179.1 DUF1269 domain-containing protein [Nocardia uniformis]